MSLKVYELELDDGMGGRRDHIVVAKSVKKVYQYYLDNFLVSRLRKIDFDLKVQNSSWDLDVSTPRDVEITKEDVLLTEEDMEFDIQHQGNTKQYSQGVQAVNCMLVWYCLKNKKEASKLTVADVREVIDVYCPFAGISFFTNETAVILAD